jgi:restriction system protein
MAIPDFQTLMLPLLKVAGDGKEHDFRDTVELISQQFNLTEEERTVLLPSGRAPLFYNRLAWAKTYLKKAGAIDQPRRGVIKITECGRQILISNPVSIDIKMLMQNTGSTQVREAESALNNDEVTLTVEAPIGISPEESIERSHELIKQELASEVLATVKICSPEFFERLVVQLLIKMGYGGSRQEAGKAVGRSGDGGIDGIINEDRLGLDAIYLQAKRWEGVVGRPVIMKFVGALAGQRATKGVFITTSGYTKEAKEYALTSQYKIVLIDGARLADLMIEHNLGVSVAATYQLKRIDSDFFADE